MNQQSTITANASPFFKNPNLAKEEAKLRILVVDDGQMMRERIVELLVDTKLVDGVDSAADVRSALDSVEKLKPHIVILDIGLPGTKELHNGIDVLRWIKQTQPNTQVVMLTNLSDTAYRQASHRLGAYAFLDKSSEFDQLPTVIHDLAKRMVSNIL